MIRDDRNCDVLTVHHLTRCPAKIGEMWFASKAFFLYAELSLVQLGIRRKLRPRQVET
jgi:hypothetical protein